VKKNQKPLQLKEIEMLLKKKLVKKLVKNDKEEICIYEFVNIN
jgi:hypothetical protein